MAGIANYGYLWEGCRMRIGCLLKAFWGTRIKRINWSKDPLTKTVGKIRLPDTDGSIKHDDCLYGKTKKKN